MSNQQSRIHLFVPCLVDLTAAATARATQRTLERLGCEVVYDPAQTCCGQAVFNAGFRDEALTLAVRFLRLFADAEAVVAPSGSCVAMVRHHYAELDLPPEERALWESLKDRTFELTEFLVDQLGVTDVGAQFPHKVTYHASCHLLRDLGVKEQPLKLLSAVQGLELVQGDWGDECCGFGGVFSARYPELSAAMADRRAAALASGGAEFITGADDSCLHHLGQAVSRQQSAISNQQSVIHIARILAGEAADGA